MSSRLQIASVLLLASISTLVAAAPTPELVTVKLPFADKDPLSAKVLGVDGQGRTTYVVEAPVTMDGATVSDFTATATLVAGADFVSVTEAAYNAAKSVGNANGAVCTPGADGNSECVLISYAPDKKGMATVTATMPAASMQAEVLNVVGTVDPANNAAAASGSGSAAASGSASANAASPSGSQSAAAPGGESSAPGTPAAAQADTTGGAPDAPKGGAIRTSGGIAFALTAASVLGVLLL